jgi:diguanylate cyclase (GGDEF)-like protein
MPTREDSEQAHLGVTIRTWHAVSAACMVVIGVLYVASTFATSEFGLGRMVPSVLGAVAVLVAVWIVSLRTRSRYFVAIWPIYLMAALVVAHYETPDAAQLVLGTLVLAFLLVGLTQPQWAFLLLLVPATVTYVIVVNLPGGQLAIRLVVGAAVWITVAALPAWLTERLRVSRAQLAALAGTDQLTLLPNRRAWDTRLGELLGDEAEHQLVVGLADLDHFKRFNDTYGHLEGDVLLADFADSLRSSVKDADIVARWGGEEFAFALIGCSRDDAVAVAHRLRAAVPRGETCSVGLAPWMPGDDASSITRRADLALYRAKENGRDRVEIAEAVA